MAANIQIKQEIKSESESEEDLERKPNERETSLMVRYYLPYAVRYRRPEYPAPVIPCPPFDDDFCVAVVRFTMEYRLFFFSVIEDHYEYFKHGVDAFWEVFFNFGKSLITIEDMLVDDRHVAILMHLAGVVATIYVLKDNQDGYEWVQGVLNRFLDAFITEKINERGGYAYFADRVKEYVPGGLYEHSCAIESHREADMRSLKEQLRKLVGNSAEVKGEDVAEVKGEDVAEVKGEDVAEVKGEDVAEVNAVAEVKGEESSASV